MSDKRLPANDRRPGNSLGRVFLIIGGSQALGLALLGVILPLLPTTPLLLLAAVCYGRSSARLYHWMHHNALFGEYLRRYRAREGIPVRVKLFTLGLLWAGILSSALLFIPGRLWPVRIMLLLVAVGVSIHVLTIKTFRGKN